MSSKCFVLKGCLLVCFPHTGFQPTRENIHLFYSTIKSSYMLLFLPYKNAGKVSIMVHFAIRPCLIHCFNVISCFTPVIKLAFRRPSKCKKYCYTFLLISNTTYYKQCNFSKAVNLKLNGNYSTHTLTSLKG